MYLVISDQETINAILGDEYAELTAPCSNLDSGRYSEYFEYGYVLGILALEEVSNEQRLVFFLSTKALKNQPPSMREIASVSTKLQHLLPYLVERNLVPVKDPDGEPHKLTVMVTSEELLGTATPSSEEEGPPPPEEKPISILGQIQGPPINVEKEITGDIGEAVKMALYELGMRAQTLDDPKRPQKPA